MNCENVSKPSLLPKLFKSMQISRCGHVLQTFTVYGAHHTPLRRKPHRETLYVMMGQDDAILQDLYSSHTCSPHGYGEGKRALMEGTGTNSRGSTEFLSGANAPSNHAILKHSRL